MPSVVYGRIDVQRGFGGECTVCISRDDDHGEVNNNSRQSYEQFEFRSTIKEMDERMRKTEWDMYSRMKKIELDLDARIKKIEQDVQEIKLHPTFVGDFKKDFEALAATLESVRRVNDGCLSR